MMVVADAGPLHYLVLIRAMNVLGPLYSRVLLPRAVLRKLLSANAPHPVRDWIAHRPVCSVHADGLLIDERAGCAEAERHHLQVTGTVGVWPKRIVLACSISKRLSASYVKPTSISRKAFSGPCGSGCRKRAGKDDYLREV